MGKHVRETLQLLSSQIVSFEYFKNAHPSGEVLSRETGFNKKYSVNSYKHYDSRALPIGWFYRKPFDDRLSAIDRILGVVSKDSATGFPFSYLNATPHSASKN